MKKIVLASLLGSSLWAQSLYYKVKAPIFGTIGEVTVEYSSGTTYSIDASMRTFGFAKKLSGNRVESYHSNGTVVGNLYKTNNFKQEFSFKKKRGLLEYFFDYNQKIVTKHRKNWKNGKLISEKNRPLTYFTYNDLFSAYHNIVVQLKGKPAGNYSVKVAGLEGNGGNLLIKIPTKAQQAKEAKSIGVSNVWVFHIITHKKLLKSTNGEVVFAVGDNGIAKGVRVLNTAYVSHLDAILSN